jgi:hypothetical protein
MKMAAAFLRSAVHLIVEDSFAISIEFVIDAPSLGSEMISWIAHG